MQIMSTLVAANQLSSSMVLYQSLAYELLYKSNRLAYECFKLHCRSHCVSVEEGFEANC